MAKQVALIERVKGKAREKALQGPEDIAGDALIKNIDFVLQFVQGRMRGFIDFVIFVGKRLYKKVKRKIINIVHKNAWVRA